MRTPILIFTSIMNIHSEPEAATFTAAPSHADLIKLQTWFSPSFPIGSFSYSHGLEWVVETEKVQDARSLARWIDGVLRYGTGRSDAIFLSRSWRAVYDEDWREAVEINSLAVALQPTFERRMESLSQGSAFLCAVAVGWPHPAIERFRGYYPGDLAYAAAVGASTAAHKLPLDAVLVASLHAFVANLVSAGVRLVPLGQSDGLSVMAALQRTVLDVAHEASLATLNDLGSACFLADIASMCHETQYTRLFRS
jgi:urease accessory protein